MVRVQEPLTASDISIQREPQTFTYWQNMWSSLSSTLTPLKYLFGNHCLIVQKHKQDVLSSLWNVPITHLCCVSPERRKRAEEAAARINYRIWKLSQHSISFVAKSCWMWEVEVLDGVGDLVPDHLKKKSSPAAFTPATPPPPPSSLFLTVWFDWCRGCATSGSMRKGSSIQSQFIPFKWKNQ